MSFDEKSRGVPCGQVGQLSFRISLSKVAELLWNSTGNCLIAHAQTEVDETGQSYYGGSRLAFLPLAARVVIVILTILIVIIAINIIIVMDDVFQKDKQGHKVGRCGKTSRTKNVRAAAYRRSLIDNVFCTERLLHGAPREMSSSSSQERSIV